MVNDISENKEIIATESEAVPVVEQLTGKKRFWLTLSAVFFLSAIFFGLVVYKMLTSPQVRLAAKYAYEKITNSQKPEVKEETPKIRRLIDGVYVATGEKSAYPVAVMIENHVDARPPSLLSAANLVYEAEAEGGITRFLAIFADGKKLDEIGPIRSARPYYLDWLSEFNALYVHCGGSPEALVEIKQLGINDLNEFYNGQYYWRDPNRPAPHNIYTSTDNLNKAIIDKGLEVAVYLSWKYKDEAPFTARPDTSEVKINYPHENYEVNWKYDKTDNIYKRYLDGEPHQDKSGEIITTKNIAIEFAEASEIDAELRLEMKTIGSGQAIVCLDGRCDPGKWIKNSPSARTRFYRLASSTNPAITQDELKEVEFNAGPTWIEVIRPEYEVLY